jgi:hypothetical protein
MLLRQSSPGVGICIGAQEEVRSMISDNYPNLMIMARNAAPTREEYYPHTWMVYSGEQTIRVHVAHDHESRPYVEDKCAA